MVNVSLFVVAEPSDERARMVMEQFPPTPFITGEGEVNPLCGDCSFVIAERLDDAAQVQSLTFRCPRCQAWNETRL